MTVLAMKTTGSFVRSRAQWKKYVLPQWRLLGLLGVFLLATIGLQLLAPIILAQFIDVAKKSVPIEKLLLIATLYICTAFAARAVRVGETYTAERLAWVATNALRIDIARHCLHLDLAFHHEHTPGELIERVDGDVSLLNNLFSRFVLTLVNSFLMLLGMLVVLLVIDVRIGLTLLGYAVLYLLVNIWVSRIPPPYFMKARQGEAELAGFLEEGLGATEDIRANGAVGYVLQRFGFFLRQRFQLQKRAELVGQGTRGVRLVMYLCGTVIVLGLSGSLYKSGAITLGIVYLAFSYTMQLWGPLYEITNQIGDFQQAVAGMARLDELLTMRSQLVEGPVEELPMGRLAVEFEDVSFGYKSGEPVLKQVSFRLAAGKVLGVLGHTGSGKTTLTRLLFRFYDPDAGRIRLNGVDVKMAKVAAVRARVAVVTQDVQLFHASVRDNLTFFDEKVPDQVIRRALEKLGLLGWLEGLPQGLDSVLSSGGLSGGQAQLVALTRVFLSDPDLVILDEASSRLDPATEALLDRAIAGLLEGRSGIIIAHRLKTVERVDEIMVLDHGRMWEYGSREQLERDPQSAYAHLLQVSLTEVVE